MPAKVASSQQQNNTDLGATLFRRKTQNARVPGRHPRNPAADCCKDRTGSPSQREAKNRNAATAEFWALIVSYGCSWVYLGC